VGERIRAQRFLFSETWEKKLAQGGSPADREEKGRLLKLEAGMVESAIIILGQRKVPRVRAGDALLG